MSTSPRDDNRVPVLKAALNTDGTTIINVKADPATNHLKTMNGNTGTDLGRNIAVRDEDRVPVLMATSSEDGITPVEVYADNDGNLLISVI